MNLPDESPSSNTGIVPGLLAELRDPSKSGKEWSLLRSIESHDAVSGLNE